MSWRLENWYVLDSQKLATERDGETLAKSEWHSLSKNWREAFPERTLDQISNAVYVIWISNPLTFDYGELTSPTAYIGKGMAHVRFRDHIKTKLLPTQEVFESAKFDFWVLECESDEQARTSEAEMLRYFEETYGRLPIFNRNRPSPSAVAAHPDCWAPLDRRRIGKQRTWAVRPL